MSVAKEGEANSQAEEVVQGHGEGPRGADWRARRQEDEQARVGILQKDRCEAQEVWRREAEEEMKDRPFQIVYPRYHIVDIREAVPLTADLYFDVLQLQRDGTYKTLLCRETKTLLQCESARRRKQ